MSDRTRGVVGRLIKAEVLEPRIRRIVAAMYDTTLAELDHITVKMDVLLLEREKDGVVEYALVNTEGVGEIASIRGITTVDVWAESGFSLVPVPVGLPLIKTLAERSNPSRPESVELADHIRTFGDRLERNFSTWRRWALNED